MDEIVFPYKLDNEYYSKVKDFGDEFIEFCQKFAFEDEEEALRAIVSYIKEGLGE